MMHGNAGLISTIINFLIIFFVVNLVVKAVKKNKKMNHGDDRSHTEKPIDKETQLNMTPTAKDLKHEQTISNRDNLSLKRCSNCGGEIPLTMMKCEICGHRQAGCGVSFIVFFLILGVIAMFLFKSENANLIGDYIKNALEWLSR